MKGKTLLLATCLSVVGCTVLTKSRAGEPPGDVSTDAPVDLAGDATPDVDDEAPPPLVYNIGDSCAEPGVCITPDTPHCLLSDPPLIGGETIRWQDGYCTSLCDPGLHQPCGASAVCGHVDGSDTGMCFAGCSIIFKCRNGYACGDLGSIYLEPASNTVCLPDPEPIEEHLGSACTVDADCGDLMDCRTDFFPGGYCTTSCRDACPDGGGCVSTEDVFDRAPGDTSYCFVPCTSDGECRGNQYACKRLVDGEPEYCLPAIVGSPCVSSSDCWVSDAGTTPLCLGEHLGGTIPGFFQGGYCSAECAAASTVDGEDPCGADAACVRLTNLEVTQQFCLASCQPGRRDCRPGYSCTPLSAGTESGTFCIPNGLTWVAPTPAG